MPGLWIAEPSLQLLYLVSMCRREDVASEFMVAGGSLSHLGGASKCNPVLTWHTWVYLTHVWCFPFLLNILHNCLNHWSTLKLFLCACACRRVCKVHACRMKDNFGESVLPSTMWTSGGRTQGLRLRGKCVCQPSHLVGLLANVLCENSSTLSLKLMQFPLLNLPQKRRNWRAFT